MIKKVEGILSLGDLRRLLENKTNLKFSCEKFLKKICIC